MKKSARYFLAGPDLGERPILFSIEVDLERLLVCPYVHLRVHRVKMWTIAGFSTLRSRSRCALNLFRRGRDLDRLRLFRRLRRGSQSEPLRHVGRVTLQVATETKQRQVLRFRLQ